MGVWGRLCDDMATCWNVESLVCFERDSIPFSLTSATYATTALKS